MKAQILALLRENQKTNTFVSGQELCGHFGVSRTAIWKVMEGLKKEGYELEAVSNKGYRLLAEPEIYSQAAIESRLTTKWAGRPLHFYESIDSTNLRAKQAAEEGEGTGALFVADMQTAGRGRRGRSWDSPAGTNVYYTILLKPEFPAENAPMLTLVMALSVTKAIRRTLEAMETTKDWNIGIKWPNDIVMSGKKVCGILTEMSMEQEYIQHIVIGVGLNIRVQEFPEELRDHAASIDEQCGGRISRSELVAVIMEEFEHDYEIFLQTQDLTGLRDSYAEYLLNRDREVCVLDPKGEWRGIARGINGTGELIVERKDGTIVEVYAGEVSVRGIYGYV